MENSFNLAKQVTAQVKKVIFGKEKEIDEIMLAFLANGHVLLEDIPGVGKTTLALAFSRAMQLDFRRIQFTPDVMPSDLTGFSVYRREEQQFVYQPGSVFCNLLLADEINRTSPKTQSALLEVMEERKVTAEGITREVSAPFLVIATQNPYGFAGTQSLPESQMDRFMVMLTLGYPDFESELRMAKSIGESDRLELVDQVLDKNLLLMLQSQVQQVYMKTTVYEYLLRLVSATRSHPYLEIGASPRATIALVRMARAAAWYDGRLYVTPNDVAGQFPYVAAHRIVPNAAARMENKSRMEIINEILSDIRKPSIGKEK